MRESTARATLPGVGVDGGDALIDIRVLDAGRAVFIWCGFADAAPVCGDVVAAVPASASSGGAATSHLLDGYASPGDADDADALAALLSRRLGKLVLLSVGGVCEGLPQLVAAVFAKAVIAHALNVCGGSGAVAH